MSLSSAFAFSKCSPEWDDGVETKVFTGSRSSWTRIRPSWSSPLLPRMTYMGATLYPRPVLSLVLGGYLVVNVSLL